MQKPKTVGFNDSNIAAIGSAEDHAAKLKAAKLEKAFDGVGTAEGLNIWRIEKFQVVAYDKKLYGTFYTGDAYIILYTYKPDPKEAKLKHRIHFWLGHKSTQDERGTAAYKTVELEDLLGGEPAQFREVQHHESHEFIDLFKGKIHLLAGGVGSGFNHMKPEAYAPRLLWIKGLGKRGQVQVVEVDCKGSSLCESDSFVLDGGLKLWQWNGANAGIFEKRKAGDVVTELYEERNGTPKKYLLDSGDKDDDFWKPLGGAVKVAAKAPEEAKQEPAAKAMIKLSEATGKLTTEVVASGSFTKDKLAQEFVYFVDDGVELFIWVGSKASKNERLNAMSRAVAYLASAKRPDHTPIRRVMSGNEDAPFKAAFDKW